MTSSSVPLFVRGIFTWEILRWVNIYPLSALKSRAWVKFLFLCQFKVFKGISLQCLTCWNTRVIIHTQPYERKVVIAESVPKSWLNWCFSFGAAIYWTFFSLFSHFLICLGNKQHFQDLWNRKHNAQLTPVPPRAMATDRISLDKLPVAERWAASQCGSWIQWHISSFLQSEIPLFSTKMMDGWMDVISPYLDLKTSSL